MHGYAPDTQDPLRVPLLLDPFMVGLCNKLNSDDSADPRHFETTRFQLLTLYLVFQYSNLCAFTTLKVSTR